MVKNYSLVCIFLFINLRLLCVFAEPEYHRLPPLREQASLVNGWRKERIENIPHILRKYGVDAWLISQKEYAEDTVFWSLKSATQFSARRRTTSIFFANAAENSAPSYTWIDNTPELWANLRGVLEGNDPTWIAVNVDSDIAFSSGLHAGESLEISRQLGHPWNERFVSQPMIAVEYVATMAKAQLPFYRKLMETAWAMIAEAFSERVITPDETTTEDVEWWLRSKIQQENFTTWFHPSVSIVEPGAEIGEHGSSARTITYGDMLHVDFGITALGLNTDTQHLAYVLPPGQSESDIPQDLLDGLARTNRLQDIVRTNMKPGLSGNDILLSSLKEMHSEGIEGKIYSHPIGDWGHSAGTLIGMTNLQDGVPILGDLPLLKNTYYSVELYAEGIVEHKNANMSFYQEEDVYWNDDTESFEWVYGRQEKFHFIKTPASSVMNTQL